MNTSKTPRPARCLSPSTTSAPLGWNRIAAPSIFLVRLRRFLRKSVQLERLQRLRESLLAMRQNEVNDPEGVLKDIADELDVLEKGVAGEIDQGDKDIVLDQKATPATR